eukprot:Sspe_Gene.1640::Locus_545_Transcript_24_28_Confidence_0.377_Length_1466::g.1640::m.1640
MRAEAAKKPKVAKKAAGKKSKKAAKVAKVAKVKPRGKLAARRKGFALFRAERVTRAKKNKAGGVEGGGEKKWRALKRGQRSRSTWRGRRRRTCGPAAKKAKEAAKKAAKAAKKAAKKVGKKGKKVVKKAGKVAKRTMAKKQAVLKRPFGRR